MEATLTLETLEEINEALNRGDINRSEAESAIEDAGIDGVQYAEDSEQFIDEDDGYLCESGKFYESDDDFITINTGRRSTVTYHTDNISEREYFQCDRSGEYFSNDNYSQIEVEGEYICQELYEDDLYYWDSDEEYHWEPEPESNIPDYHDEDRPDEWDSVLGYGIELEVYVDSPEAIHDKLPDGFLGEKDGSICEMHGIEIVGAPLKLEDYYSKDNNPWIKVFRDLDVECVQIPSSNYGMHINISKGLFISELHQAKFVVAINNLKRIAQIVARRTNVYNGGYAENRKMEAKTSKFEPVNVKDNVLEVRIFKSTTSFDNMLVSIEFCEAVRNMTRNCSILQMKDARVTEQMFCRETKGNQYKNLRKYLEDKTVMH